MSYPREVYDKALDTLAQRRQSAKNTAAVHKLQLYARLPRLEAIERELAGIGVMIARDLLGAENPDALVQKMMSSSLALQEERAEILRQNGHPPD